MFFIPSKSTVYTRSYTATDDAVFQVEPEGSVEGETLLTSVNIHCYTNDMVMGNLALQNAIIRANAVVWFEGVVRVCDLYFKNNVAGANGTITIVGLIKK